VNPNPVSPPRAPRLGFFPLLAHRAPHDARERSSPAYTQHATLQQRVYARSRFACREKAHGRSSALASRLERSLSHHCRHRKQPPPPPLSRKINSGSSSRSSSNNSSRGRQCSSRGAPAVGTEVVVCAWIAVSGPDKLRKPHRNDQRGGRSRSPSVPSFFFAVFLQNTILRPHRNVLLGWQGHLGRDRQSGAHTPNFFVFQEAPADPEIDFTRPPCLFPCLLEGV